jgi:hypothetical protein
MTGDISGNPAQKVGITRIFVSTHMTSLVIKNLDIGVRAGIPVLDLATGSRAVNSFRQKKRDATLAKVD